MSFEAALVDYFAGIGMECNLKYIRLAHNAVHAAISGKTEMVVGRWNGRFVHMGVDTSGDLVGQRAGGDGATAGVSLKSAGQRGRGF